MRLNAFIPLAILLLVGFCAWAFVPWSVVIQWAADEQRQFQESMARALQAIRSGDMTAVWALCSATAAYGFVHALGPGHGKVLLGGASLASGATLKRMTILTVTSSLAQSASAIGLVGALVVLLGLTSRQIGPLAEDWLAPLSYAAMAAIGGYLIWRGFKLLRAVTKGLAIRSHDHSHDHSHHHHDHDHSHHHDHDHGAECGCGHAHGPSLAQVETLGSYREAALLIGSIAMRPCTGALFVLVIALRFDVFWIGALSVVTMGLGTASFNLLVAWSGVAAKNLSAVQSLGGGDLQRVSSCSHILGGTLIFLLSLLGLVSYLA